jgi:CheY-like chemotaxis protein
MVIVIDDHDDTRRVLLRLLRMDGYEALSFPSGKEALTYLQSNVPTLVLTDYSMPDMNGLQIV